MRSCNDIIFLSDSSIESTGRDKHFIKLPGAARRQIQISPARLSGFWVFILSIASFSQDRSTNYFPQKSEFGFQYAKEHSCWDWRSWKGIGSHRVKGEGVTMFIYHISYIKRVFKKEEKKVD